MHPNTTTLERAFALAKTGKFAEVSDIKRRLGSEGYATVQVQGASVLKQLRDLIRASR
jgi:hypothetical protein